MEIVMSIYESLDIQKVFEIPSRDKEALMTENETTPVLNTNRYVHRNPFADQANCLNSKNLVKFTLCALYQFPLFSKTIDSDLICSFIFKCYIDADTFG